jgi:riboflavin synthase alpha subunit
MFGGLIAYRGRVTRLDLQPGGGLTLAVRCEGVERERPEPKDSVAIDGICLTAIAIAGDEIAFDVVPETLGTHCGSASASAATSSTVTLTPRST